MEITGRIIMALPLASGVSKNGNSWKKQEYILETTEQYPRKVKFDFFGERVEQYPLQVGDEVVVSFDLESREFNGRWYTDVRAWKAEKTAAVPPAPTYGDPMSPMAAPANPVAAPAQPYAAPAQPYVAPEPAAPQFTAEPSATDDLPF